ncbi:MAG: helix-turn-helix domain-containing protein [Sphingobacteriia bacterium]|nr:MAG: helix-turn-helix domain-containing protein [Sphingobacteriia bacterium]TAG29987.1 MAG: helix-turn-helix domain-containing protein [Sphingobacteriia bacterium]
MINKEKFLALVSKEKTNTLEKNNERIKNRAMLRESQQIAIKVMVKLDELGWSQKDLANALDVSPQQVTKIVSGKENLTIETQIKLQNILDIPVLASFYENKINAMEEWVLNIEKRVEKIVAQPNQVTTNYQASKTVKMEQHTYSQEYYQMAM